MAAQNAQRLILFIILVPLSIWLIWLGFRNEKDPIWQETADLLSEDIVKVGQSPDSLRLLYNRFHADDLCLRISSNYRTYLSVMSMRFTHKESYEKKILDPSCFQLTIQVKLTIQVLFGGGE